MALQPRLHLLTLAALAANAPAVSGCSRPATCLTGSGGCERAAICEDVDLRCDDSELFVGRLGDRAGGSDLRDGEGTAGDLVLQNAHVTVVVDAIDEPHGLAPTGGTIIDFGPRGGRDDVFSIYQLAGILPDDAFSYREIEIVDRSPDLVAVVLRGSLDGRPAVEVVTRYELRPCDPGVRVRSELRNGSTDIQAFLLADVAHWGKRNALPFAPVSGQGFLQPELDLLELTELYDRYPYVVARAAEEDASTYGFVRCDRDELDGVNDPEVSALGTAPAVVRPGEEVHYQRFLVATGGRDLSTGVSAVAELRRQLHGDPEPRTVSGRTVSGGLPHAGGVRRAVVVIAEEIEGSEPRPLTTVVPDDMGRFQASVVADGALRYEVWSFGRALRSGTVADGLDIGDVELPLPARLTARVDLDGEAAVAELVVHPADDATRERVAGSWFGRFGDCAPWLGPPVAGSPSCNRVLVPEAGVDFELPHGSYEIWATAGAEATLARAEVEVAAGEIADVVLAVESVDVAPPGWVAADLHVHGQRSFDSSLPDRDRVLSFLAHGVDIIAATDHDFVGDYREVVEELAVGDRVTVLGGLESTPLIPFLDVVGEDIPRVIGHFNHWPLVHDPLAPRGGAPWDELLEPGELFDRLRPSFAGDGLHMMNHPWDDTQFGRDLGYLRAIGFDPRRPIPDHDDGSANGQLMRSPGGGSRNVDFDLIELMNGAGVDQVIKTRPLWFALLRAGLVRAATANSDSHSLVDNQLGYGRNYVHIGAVEHPIDSSALRAALLDGRVVGGNGVFIATTVGQPGGERRGLGLSPHRLRPGDTLEIEVRAAPWIPITEVRVITASGERVVVAAGGLEHPDDPLAADGVVRLRASFALDELIAGEGDDFVIVEAGLPFFAAIDLDDDGVIDTTDNDGDGDIDEDDVEDEDDDSGPLVQPEDPLNRSDRRFAMTRVIPGAWSYGFINPILIDVDGDGWAPPEEAR